MPVLIPPEFLGFWDASGDINYATLNENHNHRNVLLARILTGAIRCFAIDESNGNLLTVPLKFWRTSTACTYIAEFRDCVRGIDERDTGLLYLVIPKIDITKEYPELVYDHADEPDLSSVDGKSVGKTSDGLSAQSRGGRPIKFNWEDFYLEAAHYAALNSLDDPQAVRQHLKDWIAVNWEEQPSEGILKQKFAKLLPAQTIIRGPKGR